MPFRVPFNFLNRSSANANTTDLQQTGRSEGTTEDLTFPNPVPEGGVVETKYGLKILDDQQCGSEVNDGVDIIAVHGLGGEYRDTWTHLESGTFWLKDFLSDQLNSGGRRVKARVLSFGYDAKTLFTASNLNIDTIARLLLHKIKGKRQEDAEKERPIVFIAHSLGGIVVKKCMNYAHERESHYGDILGKVQGILFLAVPHRGLVLADWTSTITQALETLHFPSNPQLLAALQKESTQFFDISKAWVERSSPLRITSFYETLKPIVVDEQSSTLGLQNEIVIPLSASTHRSICKFAGPEDENFESVLMELRETCVAALKVAPKKGMAEAHLPRELQQTIEDSDRQDLIQSLSFPEMLDRRENIPAPHPGTCEWILQHETYEAWLCDMNGLLWIRGPPGSGKSVLMSFLFESWDQQDSADEVVRLHHFFNRRGVELQHSGAGMLRSLIWQLSNSHAAASSRLDISFNQKRKLNPQGTITWSLEELKRGFLHALQVVAQSAPISIFVDALDEVDSQDFLQVIKHIHEIHDKFAPTEAPIKICVSSRHCPVAPTNGAREIFVESNNGNDIARLIQHEFRLYKQTPGAADDASLQGAALWVSSHAKGLFQWVSLVLPLVAKMFTGGRLAQLENLETSLRGTSGDLGGLYSHIITQTIEQDKLKTSLSLFRFICHATRPLSLEEILSALEFLENEGMKAVNSPRGYSQYPSEVAGSLIRSLSGGLIHVVSAKVGRKVSDSESRTLQIQTIHQSVNDFMISDGLQLLEGRISKNTPVWQNYSTEPCNHFYLADFCLQYIIATSLPADIPSAWISPPKSLPIGAWEPVDIPSEGFRETFAIRPALNYAAKSLFEHISRCEKQDFTSSFLFELITNFRKWQCILVVSIGLRRRRVWLSEHNGGTIFHSCVDYNALTLLQRLLESLGGAMSVDLDEFNYGGATALHLAVTNDNLEIIQILSQAGASTAAGHEDDTPFFTALKNGNVRAAKRLLELSPDPKNMCRGRDDDSSAVVHAILSDRRLEMLDLLRLAGADPNRRGTGPEYTPLQIACAFRDEALVKQLLDMGADPNQYTESSEGLLLLLAWDSDNRKATNVEQHSIDIADLLFSKGIRKSGYGGGAGNALAEAIKEGKKHYAAYLSGKGATPTTEQLSRALAEKCLWGPEDVSCIKQLLDRGALPNLVIEGILGRFTRLDEHFDAVQASLWNGWEEALTMLLAAGGKLPDQAWLQDALYESAYHLFGFSVRLLLLRGADANGAPKSPFSTEAPMTVVADTTDFGDRTLQRQFIARLLIEAGATMTEQQRAKIFPNRDRTVGAEFREVKWQRPRTELDGPGLKAPILDSI